VEKHRVYRCKSCGKEDTKERLRHHICENGIEKHFDDDDDLLATVVAIGVLSFIDTEIPLLEPEIESGEGEFSGGGASGDYDAPSDTPSDSGSDSGG